MTVGALSPTVMAVLCTVVPFKRSCTALRLSALSCAMDCRLWEEDFNSVKVKVYIYCYVYFAGSGVLIENIKYLILLVCDAGIH